MRIAALAIAAACAAPIALAGFPDGPPPAHTGAFGEPSCTACHAGDAANAGTGVVRVIGLPEHVTPGERYVLRVELLHEGMQRAGFQLSARLAGGGQAGTLAPLDSTVAVVTHAGVQYAQHTRAGSMAHGGAKSWSVEWCAPDEAAVEFAVAAVAGDDDASPLGDWVYAAHVAHAHDDSIFPSGRSRH